MGTRMAWLVTATATTTTIINTWLLFVQRCWHRMLWLVLAAVRLC